MDDHREATEHGSVQLATCERCGMSVMVMFAVTLAPSDGSDGRIQHVHETCVAD